ncbi:TauD/TfdA family dioxygenase [Rhizobium ruizarguesonis]|uniref:TauD/TfdA family dioxygenase n=1 Tax=Rhizobium ruizarguesonis TaxID=2081791 RepID=UPI0010301C89|nr:TauD/TfdA family dioxygenase [Rhizobium ruizarguesonis]TBA92812.1 hypothetical protein ELH54_24700 [Rhizobium ruizarguesonis]
MQAVRDGWLHRMDAGVAPAQVKEAIRGGAGILIPNFPLDSKLMLSLLRGLGEPLAEYSRLISDEADADKTGVNVVKLRAIDQTGDRTHHRAGELRLHTARSWAYPRPRYFAMLMVEPGWRDSQAGFNGESLIVPWRAVLQRIRDADPIKFDRLFSVLSETPVSFHADRVREAVSDQPIIYSLPDARDPFDVGIRVKQDLPAVLRRLAVTEEVAAAVEYLQTLGGEIAREKLAVLERGSLIIVDNNRWAHGRCAFEVARGDLLNPREVWSATVS